MNRPRKIAPRRHFGQRCRKIATKDELLRVSIRIDAFLDGLSLLCE
jgi:hypothetical protein